MKDKSVHLGLVLLLGVVAISAPLLVFSTTGDVSTQELEPGGEIDEEFEIPQEPTNSSSFDFTIDGNVENLDGVDGGATYNFTSELNVDTLPYRYPTTVTIRAYEGNNTNDANLVASESQQVTFRPRTDDDAEYTVSGDADFVFEQSSDTQYTFEAEIVQPYNNPDLTDSSTYTVTGSNESSTNISLDVISSEEFRELPTVESVQSFRVSESSNNFQESSSLPSQQGVDFSGNVTEFANMTVNDSSATLVESTEGSLHMTTSTQFIEPGEPQTVIIRAAPTGSNPINLSLIDGTGSVIDDSTTYTLSNDRSDLNSRQTMIEGEVSNIYAIKLTEEEKSYLNNQGEMFLTYTQNNGNASAQIFCQDVVSGSLTFDTNVCGTQSDTAQSESSVNILNFDILNTSSGSPLGVGSEYRTTRSALSDKGFYVEIRNNGTEPIPADETAFVFSNTNPNTDYNGTTPVSLSSGTDFNQTPDEETVNVVLPEVTPTSAIEIQPDVNTNESSLEVLVEDPDSGRQDYFKLSNVNGTQQLPLDDLGGRVDSLDITLNSTEAVGSGDQAQINSIDVRIIEYDSTNNVEEVTVGGMTGGAGDLPPKTDRVHRITTVDWDEHLKSTGGTFYLQIRDSSEKIQIRTSQDEIVANSGGPYEVVLESTGATREQVGTHVVEAVDRPGPEYEQVGTVGGTSGQDSYTTTYDFVPRVDLPDDETLNYWENKGYIAEPEKALPPGWNPDDMNITYTERVNTEEIAGTRDDIDDLEGGYSASDAGWNTSGFGGRSIRGYTLQESSLQYIENEDSLEWSADDSGAVYYPQDEDTFDATSEDYRVVGVLEQSSDPTNVLDAPRCEDIGGPDGLDTDDATNCWQDNGIVDIQERDPTAEDESRLYYTEEDLNNNVSPSTVANAIGKNTYSDPGPEYTYVGYLSGGGGGLGVTFVYSKLKTEQVEIHEWRQYAAQEAAQLHVPQEETFDTYERPVYEAQVTWTKNVSSGTVKEWEGPVYTNTKEFGDVNLPVSSQSTPANLIEEYSWELETGATASGVDPQLTLDGTEVSSYDSLELTHRVRGSGQEDTDTTVVDIIENPGESSGVDYGPYGTRQPRIDIEQYTKKTDYRHQEGAIDVEVITGRDVNTPVELVVEPGYSALVVNATQDGCSSEFYERVDESEVNLSNYDGISFASDSMAVDPDSDGRFCRSTTQSSTGGPPLFEHPDAIGVESRLIERSGSNVATPLWQGETLPIDDFRKIAYIDPQQNSSITPGVNEFEVRLQYSGTDDGGVIDRETVEIEFCDAYSPQYNCAELDSDLDTETDGPFNTPEADPCPYVPAREPPCDLFGASDDIEDQTIGWGINPETRQPEPWGVQTIDSRIFETQTRPNSSEVYGPDNLKIGPNSESINGVIQHIPMNDGLENKNTTRIDQESWNQIDDATSSDNNAYLWTDGWTNDIGTNTEYSLTRKSCETCTSRTTVYTTTDADKLNDSESISDQLRVTRIGTDRSGVIIRETNSIVDTLDDSSPSFSDYDYQVETSTDDPRGQFFQDTISPTGLGMNFTNAVWLSAANNDNGTVYNDANEQYADAISNEGVSISTYHNPDFSQYPSEKAIVDSTTDTPLIVASTESNSVVRDISTSDLRWDETDDALYYNNEQAGEPILLDAPVDGRADGVEDYEVRTYSNISGGYDLPIMELVNREFNLIGEVSLYALTGDDRLKNETTDPQSQHNSELSSKYLADTDDVRRKGQLEKDWSVTSTSANPSQFPNEVGIPVYTLSSYSGFKSGFLSGYEGKVTGGGLVFEDTGWEHIEMRVNTSSTEESIVRNTNNGDISYNFNTTVPDFNEDNLTSRERGGNRYLYYDDPNGTYSAYLFQINIGTVGDDIQRIYDTETLTKTADRKVTAVRNGDYTFGTVQFDYGSFNDQPNNLQLRIGGSQSCYEVGCGDPRPPVFNRYTGNMSDMVSRDLSVSGQFAFPQDTRFRTVTVGEKSITDEAINYAEDGTNEVTWNDVSVRKENFQQSLRTDWSSPFSSPTNAQIRITPTRIEDNPIPDGTDRGDVVITYFNDPTTTGSSGGSGDTNVTIQNTLEEDVNYTAFEASIGVHPLTTQPMNNTSLDNFVIKNFNPRGNGSLEIRDTQLSTSGNNNTVPAGSTDGGDGGSVLYNTRLSQDLESPSNITGKWVIRDNSVQIDSQTISSQDGSVLSGEVNWRELQDKGITPRAEPYVVDFVLEEGNGWSQERVKIGEIVVEDSSSP